MQGEDGLPPIPGSGEDSASTATYGSSDGFGESTAPGSEVDNKEID